MFAQRLSAVLRDAQASGDTPLSTDRPGVADHQGWEDRVPIVIRRSAPSRGCHASREAAWPALAMTGVLVLAVSFTILMLAETHRLPTISQLFELTPPRLGTPAAATLAPVIWPSETTSDAGSQEPVREAGDRGEPALVAGPMPVWRADAVSDVSHASDRLPQPR